MAWLTSCGGAANPLYNSWPNFPQQPSFFPIAIWLQNPTANTVAGHSNVAQAAAACGINTMLGVDDGGSNWPSGFGTDDGQMAAIYAAGLKLVGYGQTLGLETSNNTAINSVASLKALDVAQGGGRTLIGYNGGDEPSCGAQINAVPGMASAVAGYDPTRPFFCNLFPTGFTVPAFNACQAATVAALQATGVGSFDTYPFINPFQANTGSDFISVPQDALYAMGLGIQTMRYYARSGQPLWAFVECGSDSLGAAGGNNSFTGGISNGSANLTNASGFSSFTASWIGLTVTGAGIQANTVISSVTNATTAVMSKTATATNAAVAVTVTGGDLTDCVASANLCVVNGNRYRAAPREVAAEVWMAIINGANGIEWFSHDTTAFAYALGATAGGAGALAVAANLTHINGVLKSYAAILNATTVGICSMDSMDPVTGTGPSTVASSCSNGILTMATSDVAVPGAALAKSYQGATYLLAQSSRRGSAAMTFTLTGKAGQTATVIYDTNSRYNSANSGIGNTSVLNGSAQFSDTFGANSNHYQTKIYLIA